MEEEKPNPKPNLWSKIKSFFTSKKNIKSVEILETPLKAFIQRSEYNQLIQKDSDFVYKFPGLKESEVEDFLMIYYSHKQHQCKHCLKEKILILRILQKDILVKIFMASELTKDSIKILSQEYLHEGFYQMHLIHLQKQIDLKIFDQNKSNLIDSTRSNTNYLETPQNEKTFFQIQGIKNSIGKNFITMLSKNDENLQNKRMSQKTGFNFSEYNYEFESSKKKKKNNFFKKTPLKKFRMSVQTQQKINSKNSNLMKSSLKDFGKNDEPADSKSRRMSKRNKSKLSNIFSSDNKKIKFLGNSKNFIQSEKKIKINKMSNKKNNVLLSDGLENKILIPKSTLTLEWSESVLNPYASPKNNGFKSRKFKNNKINEFTSLKNIQIVNNANFQNDETNEKWFLNSKKRKTYQNDNNKFFKLIKTKSRFSTKNSIKQGSRKSTDWFRLEEIDKMKKVKDLDFSRMNSNPRR